MSTYTISQAVIIHRYHVHKNQPLMLWLRISALNLQSSSYSLMKAKSSSPYGRMSTAGTFSRIQGLLGGSFHQSPLFRPQDQRLNRVMGEKINAQMGERIQAQKAPGSEIVLLRLS